MEKQENREKKCWKSKRQTSTRQPGPSRALPVATEGTAPSQVGEKQDKGCENQNSRGSQGIECYKDNMKKGKRREISTLHQ